MSWQNRLNDSLRQFKGSVDWLIEESDPGVRYLALRDLLELPEDDPELVRARQEAYTQGPIAQVLDQMNAEGYWCEPGPGYLPKYRSTVWSVILLAQLGASVEADPDGENHRRIRTAGNYLLEHALTPNGQFTISGAPSGTVDCLQGNLCWALTVMGFRDDRLTTAFEWMARTVTGEGIAPMEEKEAKLRYYSGKIGPRFACGANNKLPCAWGAAKVMLAFGSLPGEDKTPVIEGAIQEGVDFLLGVDPVTAAYPTGYSDKPSGNWWKFGFPVFYITDLLQIIEALAGLGYASDPRLENAWKELLEKGGEQGRWALEFDYTGKAWVDFGKKKEPNKWVTLRALRALKAYQPAL